MKFSPSRIGLVIACGLLGMSTAIAQNQPPPMLRITFNDGSPQQMFCLEAAPATIDVLNDETFIEVTAFPQCPPSDNIQIDSFLVDVDPNAAPAAGTNVNFDINNDVNNCSVGGQTTTCLFFTWDTLVGFNVDVPSCTIQQDGSPVMTPTIIINPSNNAPAEPPLTPSYVEDLTAPGLAWPINIASVTAGTSLTYRLNCTGVPSTSEAVTVNFVDNSTPPSVQINNFNVTQTNAAQGSTVNFSYNVSLLNGPTSPSCTLTSPSTISSQTFAVSGGTGSGTASILASSPTGNRTFTLSCRPDATTAPTDTDTDIVNVTTGGGTGAGCPATIPGTTISRDTSKTEFRQLYSPPIEWPGQWGVSGADQRLNVQRNRYMALRFNTSTADPDELRGRFEWGKSGVGGIPAAATYTITSDCADFSPTNIVCRRFSSGNRLPWHLPGSSNPENGSCPLQPNTQYYLNIIYDDTSDGFGGSTCPTSVCNHLINAGGGPPTFPN